MQRGIRAAAAATVVAAASFVIRADTAASTRAADIQLQLGQLLFQDGRYGESLEAFQKAIDGDDPVRTRVARVGVVQSALRVAEFTVARREAEALLKSDPRNPEALSLS